MQIASGRVRRKTEPTGLGENIELPKCFLKLYETAHTGLEKPFLTTDNY
jgi:hypothetical protein